MALYNLSGHQQHHDVNEAVSLLTQKKCGKCFSTLISELVLRFFITVLTEMNVNISNKLNFSNVYQSVN